MGDPQGGFLSFTPEDIERYWLFRDAIEYLLGRRKQLTQRLKRGYGRVSVMCKIKTLLALQLLSRHPALFVDVKGLCYVAGIPYLSKDQRNVEIWLKKTVEGKWRNGSARANEEGNGVSRRGKLGARNLILQHNTQ